MCTHLFEIKLADCESESFTKIMLLAMSSCFYSIDNVGYVQKNHQEMNSFEQQILKCNSICEAVKLFNEMIIETELQPCYIELISSDLKKKEQESLLKGKQISRKELLKLFYVAEEQGYLFSHYVREKKQNSVPDESLPTLIYINEKDDLEHIGDTPLSDGQMRQLVEQRRVLVADIIEKAGHWHCFIRTYFGLKGKEPGEFGGSPHIHYTSDAFGTSKEQLIDQIKRGEYHVANVHIPLSDM